MAWHPSAFSFELIGRHLTATRTLDDSPSIVTAQGNRVQDTQFSCRCGFSLAPSLLVGHSGVVGVSLCSEVCSASSTGDTRYADVCVDVCTGVCVEYRGRTRRRREINQTRGVRYDHGSLGSPSARSYNFGLTVARVACSHGVELG